MESLIHEQTNELERVLWAAVRALEESAAIAARLSRSEKGDLAARFAEKAAAQLEQASYLRNMLFHGNMLSPDDGRRV